ncbi:hypothetical protein HNP38_002555 [Chryseobacterium defluvii]|uniref:DUF3945 domain-containing protein n=1 Tax=Chryseobacterium defluvii TaxID=160396 RepID=A0A840KCY2_9FLAO|nr:hypothetical protein [Chryseobacterium defluvii]MBB4807251.1 hypothetical protein [Chryseobacterium defluvii]
MENNTTFLTDDLKRFGIMTEDNQFSKKLSQQEVYNFLKGGVLIAENDQNRLTFKIAEDKLSVNVYNKDWISHKDLSSAELLEVSSKNTNLYKVMADYGTITHIGKSHFNNNPENEITLFVEVENDRGKTRFFGNKLEESLKSFKIGEKVQITQTGIEKAVLNANVDGEIKEITRYDNLFIIRPFDEKNKEFQSRLFELDAKDKTIKDIDTIKYELQTVNGHTLSEKQLQLLRKGKEIKLDDETTIQLSPKADNEKNLSASVKVLLITSLALDGGITFLIIKGIQKLAKIQEENHKQHESQKYLTELQKLKSFLQSKAEQYPDNKQIITDLNIVGKEISNVQAAVSENQNQEKNDDAVRLKGGDPDLFEDANQKKEEERRNEEDSRKSTSFSRGR